MANSLTYYGQAVCLFKDIRTITNFATGITTDAGGFAKIAARLRLYLATSNPQKSGAGTFNEVTYASVLQIDGSNPAVYTSIPISETDWTTGYANGNFEIKLNDMGWLATGTVANIGGAYITDVDGNVMAWFERATPVTLSSGDKIIADDLIIRLG